MRYPPQTTWQITLAMLAAAAPVPRAWPHAIGEQSPLDFDADRGTIDFQDEQAGVRAGSLRLLPSAAGSVAYDSNVFASPTARDAQVLSLLEGQLHLENDPGASQFAGDGFARTRRFREAHDQDTTEYGVSTSLDTLLGSGNEFSGAVLAQRRFESRAEVETPDIRSVSFYDESRASLSYSHTFNHLALRSTVSGQRFDFAESSERIRDRASYRGELGAAYQLHNGFSWIGSGYYSEDDYRFASPFTASAETVGAMAGVRLNVPDIADFELSGGYFQRHFAGDLGEISGLSLSGSLTWHPTRLLIVRADLQRQDAPTRVTGAFGKVRTSGTLGVLHSYSRSVELYARGRIIEDRFDIIRESVRTFSTETGATWMLSRRYVLAAEYDYATRTSAAIDSSFARHLLSLSLIGRF